MKSIIIPVFNEEEMIQLLYERVLPFLDDKDELLFINDGSTDGTVREIKVCIKKDQRIKLINFSRNFGHQSAVSAGLKYSKGDYVVVMDADLQDPPELIPELVKKWEEGYEVVHCVRKHRKESLIKKISYKIFYWIYTKTTDFSTVMESGDFSLIGRRAVNEINNMSEQSKFIRGLRSYVGFKQTSVEYERDARTKGKPKYNIIKLYKLAMDGIFSFSTLPLRLMTILGFGLLLISFFTIITLFYFKLTREMVVGHTLTYMLVLFFGGINLFCFGIIGEYIGKIFYESKKRPPYIIESVINVNSWENGS